MPTYKGEARLPRVLECLKSQGVDMDVHVRDNNVNGILYTRAMNEGIKKFASRPDIQFILAICDDVYMRPNSLARLIEFAMLSPKAGIIAPVQVDRSNKVTWAGSTKSWPLGVHIVSTLDKPYQTHLASGACFLIRTDMVKEIGLMDPNMRFICSDSDYSMTARARGWQVWVVPDAEVEHEFGGSQSNSNPEMDRIKHEDCLAFTEKWLSGGLFRKLEAYGNLITPVQVDTELRAIHRTLASVHPQRSP